MQTINADRKNSTSDTTLPISLHQEHVQVVLFGRGGAGKTSLLGRLQDNPFDPDSPSTAGVDIQEAANEFCGIKDRRVDLWDFAGQVVTHPLHNLFLNRKAVYIIVLTGDRGRKTNDCHQWARTIMANCKGNQSEQPKIIIVNNKCQDASNEQVKVDFNLFQERYPAICAQVSTDCKTGFGINELKQALETSIQALPTLQPSKELTGVMLEIEQRLKNTLSGQDLVQTLESAGISDPTEQLKAVNEMRASGLLVTLNLQQDNLAACTVANPRWVSAGLYGILRLGEAFDGVMSHKNIESKFPNYNQADLDLFLQQLESLELLFQDKKSKQLLMPFSVKNYVPADIRAQFPTFTTQNESQIYSPDQIKFKFKFENVDPTKLGIVSRLIVKNADKAEVNNIWQDAGIIKHNGASAFFQIPYETNEVQLTLTGGTSEARKQLAKELYQQLIEITKANSLHEVRADLCLADGWVNIQGALINKERGKQSSVFLYNDEGTEFIDTNLCLSEMGLS